MAQALAAAADQGAQSDVLVADLQAQLGIAQAQATAGGGDGGNVFRAQMDSEECRLDLGRDSRNGDLDPALCWTGCKDTGRGGGLSVIGYHNLTRPKSFHLKKA